MTMKMDADADLEHAADHDDIDVGDYECDDAPKDGQDIVKATLSIWAALMAAS